MAEPRRRKSQLITGRTPQDAAVAEEWSLLAPSDENTYKLSANSFDSSIFTEEIQKHPDKALYFDITDTLLEDDLVGKRRVYLTSQLLKELLESAQLVCYTVDPRAFVNSFVSNRLFNEWLKYDVPHTTKAETPEGIKVREIYASHRHSKRSLIFHLDKETLPEAELPKKTAPLDIKL